MFNDKMNYGTKAPMEIDPGAIIPNVTLVAQIEQLRQELHKIQQHSAMELESLRGELRETQARLHNLQERVG